MTDSLQGSKPCSYSRRRSIAVQVGDLPLGGDAPIRLQSMANVSTLDTEASISQAERVIQAGADLVRFTAQGRREATNLANIRLGLDDRGLTTPLVADIHFNPQAADEALERIEKVRVNPGNYVDTKTATPREWTQAVHQELHQRVVERFGAFVARAKELGRTIRIGVNHGSLSERMVMLYGDTPEGMVQSALEYLDVCRQHDFTNVVISMKSSNTTVMTSAMRLLVRRLDEGGYPAYPLHLGVTEAGEGEDGRVKSAVGIGSLLMDGIGDTIRVSLSEEPELEIPVAKVLVDYVTSRPALPSESLEDAPEWDEYYTLARGSRAKAHTVGRALGASALPAVVMEETLGTALDSSEEMCPDFVACGDGSLRRYQSDGEPPLCAGYVCHSYHTLDLNTLRQLSETPERILILEATDGNAVASWRMGLTRVARHGLRNPILLAHTYTTDCIDTFRLQAAADLGTILLDGWAHGLYLSAPNIPVRELIRTQFGILQATRLRMSRTEFISCPGCGRTLYNLQETIARVKAATSHLKGLKIGIMGCIVNGPGEMADADYGYVGAAPGKIDLYKGQTCIRKGVAQEEAVEQLIDLIRSEGDWVDPS